MLVTKEQQEALVEKYLKAHTPDECIGFIDGINATLELLGRIEKQEKYYYYNLKIKR